MDNDKRAHPLLKAAAFFLLFLYCIVAITKLTPKERANTFGRADSTGPSVAQPPGVSSCSNPNCPTNSGH